MNKEKVVNCVSWVLQIAAAFIMLRTLQYKFGAHPYSVELFSALGMEPTGRILIGVLELLAGLMLLLPRVSASGAVLGAGVMMGAVIAHLTTLGIDVGDGGVLFMEACGALLSCLIVAYIRRKDIPFIGKTL